MYCANNPVMYIDENGDAWWNPATWNWKKIGAIVGAVVAVVAIAAVTVATMGVAATAIAASIGATIGAISYTASVVGTGITTGNWIWSWGDFLGSTFGGTIGGMLSIIPGLGSFGTGFVTGGLTSLVSDAFNYAIYDEKKSFLSVVLDFFVSGTIGGISSKIVSNLVKVPGINKGQGSLDQVTKQIYKKLSKGIISKISMKTLGKMFVLGLFSELPSLWLNNYKVLF